MPRSTVALLALPLLLALAACRSNAPERVEANALSAQAGVMEASLRTNFAEPVRRVWRITNREVEGLPGTRMWHVAGTRVWVRFVWSPLPLDQLDVTRTYAIDATALAQNYGVIDFYVYDVPQPVE
ncbi:MAG: hypothetical protein R3F34_16205 [Planctomycetota bacterium]